MNAMVLKSITTRNACRGSEGKDGEEILIEQGNIEHIREYYRVQFMSIFHWSELNSAYSCCIDYLTISDTNTNITGHI